MNKSKLIVSLALLVLLTCICIFASSCGKENETTPAQAQQQNQTGTTAQTAKPTSVISGGWGDIPIYPGAKEVFKLISDQDETLNDQPAIFEHRMYELSAKRVDVVAFYKDKMPANGWKETSWMEMGSGGEGGSIAQYDKNDGQAMAVVTCTDTDEGTVLTLDKKSIK